MNDIPSWAIAILLAAIFLLSLEGGWLAYQRLRRAGEGGSTGAGYIVAASLGLLSLLMGFTLALSLDRYEIRRNLVVDEAGAISTTWLRDQLLDEPFRGRLAALLRDYVEERRGLATVGTTEAALDAADRRADALQQRIWQETAVALRAPGSAALTTPVLQATNAMFDLPPARRAALDAVVPPAVLWTLVIVAILAALTTGYGLGAGGHRHRLASGGLFLAAALIISLIVDLDEPRGGMISVPQDPLDRTAAAILSAPPVR